MIVVKLELWPKGDESRKVDLGTAHITNVSGAGRLASYSIRLLKGARYSKRPGELYKSGEVPAFPRLDKRWGPWELLALALEATIGTRIASLNRYLQTTTKPGDEAI